MRYTIAVQNLQLQVRLPDGTDTTTLDRVVRDFNDHLVTFNDGKSIDLFPSKEVNLLILTMISFILGMMDKQKQLEETKRTEPAASQTAFSAEDSTIQDAAVLATVKHLIELCDEGLKRSE